MGILQVSVIFFEQIQGGGPKSLSEGQLRNHSGARFAPIKSEKFVIAL